MNRCCGEELGDRSMCDRNPRHEEFDRVVATWETVRHFDIDSFDTVRPICKAEPCHFDEFIGRNGCENRCHRCPRRCHCCRNGNNGNCNGNGDDDGILIV